jgi:sigma-B regulation protein RsbU (phosphoserine phosphatase)
MATTGAGMIDPTMDLIATLPPDRVQELLKLQKAAQKINSILDLDQLIDKIVNDIACSFGCMDISVYLHEPENSEMVLAGVEGCRVHDRGHRLKIGKEGLVGYVAATGQMRYAPDVSVDPYYIGCGNDTRSEVAIPLHVDGKLVGVFTASHNELNGFDADRLWLLQSLSSHIAVAVQNALRFKQERSERERMSREAQEARSIQQALLPKASPFIPGFAVSGLSIPAGAIGGDWYDFIDLGDGRWGLVIADVSGKGTAAALLMSATRAMLRSLAENACTPSEVLTKLNRLMVEDFPSGRFVTMVYAVLDSKEGTLTYANAGHLMPLLVDSSGARFLETEMGLPLGIGHGMYSEAMVPLSDQARIALYSDGITEATNAVDEEYGAARLQAHFENGGKCPETLIDDVRAFANGAGLHDDATVIMLRRL